ncbi:MAG: 30S ribosomal protein S27ae [Candidatus Diapherotrites archaeon]
MADKKPVEKKKSNKTKKGNYYKMEGEKAARQKKFCPKCGPGVFLAEHSDRQSCGKCGYTEWKR